MTALSNINYVFATHRFRTDPHDIVAVKKQIVARFTLPLTSLVELLSVNHLKTQWGDTETTNKEAVKLAKKILEKNLYSMSVQLCNKQTGMWEELEMIDIECIKHSRRVSHIVDTINVITPPCSII